MRIDRWTTRAVAGAAALLLASACSPDGGTAPERGARGPIELVIVSGNGQVVPAGEKAAPIVARVVDANGNPVQGQIVNFVITKGGGSVFAGSNISNGEGIVTERWTVGTTAGAPNELEARAVKNPTGEELVFGTFTATVIGGPATGLSIVSGDGQTALDFQPLPNALTVQAVDQYNNASPNVAITWSPAAGDGSASPASSVTGANGRASTTWTLGAAGPHSLVASTSTGLSVTFSATATTSSEISLTVLSWNMTERVAGTTGTAELVARNQHGVPAANFPVTLTFSPFSLPAGSTLPSSVTTDANGRATITWGVPCGADPYTGNLYSGTLFGYVAGKTDPQFFGQLSMRHVSSGAVSIGRGASSPASQSAPAGSTVYLEATLRDACGRYPGNIGLANGAVSGVTWTTSAGTFTESGSSTYVHNAPSVGIYASSPVNLSVPGGAGQTANVTATLANGQSVSFSVTATGSTTARQARFDAYCAATHRCEMYSHTSDDPGNITRRVWTMGDGTVYTGNSSTRVHTYAASGSYSVRLEVTWAGGATHSITKTVVVP